MNLKKTYSNFVCSLYVKHKILYKGNLIQGKYNS